MFLRHPLSLIISKSVIFVVVVALLMFAIGCNACAAKVFDWPVVVRRRDEFDAGAAERALSVLSRISANHRQPHHQRVHLL